MLLFVFRKSVKALCRLPQGVIFLVNKACVACLVTFKDGGGQIGTCPKTFSDTNPSV